MLSLDFDPNSNVDTFMLSGTQASKTGMKPARTSLHPQHSSVEDQ